jgi:hypothetical protein
MSNQAIRRLMPLAVLLSLLMARSAVAQGTGQIIAGAHTSGAPNVIGFADTAQGSAPSDDVAKATTDQFNDTDWAFFDDGTLVIGKNAQPILITGYLGSQDKSFFVFHRRDPKFTFDGTVIRDPQNPKQGQAEFWYAVIADDGKSASTSYALISLTFVQ